MCEQTITKTQAVYNRSLQLWQVIAPTGEITNEFPKGEQGRNAATLEAIRQDDPNGYQCAADFRFNRFNLYPMTWPRIWKAARIVADEAVYMAHPLSQYNDREAYHVKSQSDDLFYIVTRLDTFYACTCPDCNLNHAPTIDGQKLCKHIFAVKIMKAMQREIPPYLDSPRGLFRWLEETGAAYKVVGAYNRRPYLYARPQQRPAVAGELIEHDGQTWRVMHNGQGFNLWRVGLPVPIQPDPEPATEIVLAQQPTPAALFEEAQAIETARLFGNVRRIDQYERGMREKLRQHEQQAEIAAWKRRKAAEAVAVELFN